SGCIRTLVWTAYTLLFLIFTYMIGFMQSSSIKMDMYPVWAVSFFAVLGCTNSITAFELDDNKQWMKHYIQLILYYTYVSVLLQHMSDAFVVTSVTLLFTVTIYKNFMQIQASVLASDSWYSSKLLADYMKHDADSNESRYDPISLSGFSYLVCCVVIATENIITADQIWRCDGRLMKSTEGLLATAGKDYSRAFKVIEVELSFLYDFFFAKYALMYYRVLSLALLDMLQLILYWFSEWGKVSLTCRYVSHLWWQKNKFIERNLFSSARLHCFRIGRTKIGQYSILQSFEGKYL
ncbi:hypothetical protein BDA96_09G184700, partial [Sorghum bicolor]